MGEEKVEPIWTGRSSDTVADSLNYVLQEHGLPYIAVVEGEPKCYDTVRYGWICTYDYLPVYIVRKSDGRKVRASLTLYYDSRWQESGLGYASGRGSGCAHLRIEDDGKVVELDFPFSESMHDYMYSYSFGTGPC